MRRPSLHTAIALSLVIPWLLLVAAPAGAEPVTFKVEKFLDGPSNGSTDQVDLAWAPGTKRIFFSEEDTGKIRIINNGKLLGEPCITLGVATDRDKGLTGLVLHPDFSANKWLYAYYTADTTPPENRVTRFTVENGKCKAAKTIIAGLGIGIFHQGGQMAFDENNKLFITTGENNKRALAQDLSSPMGKVLRLNDDGTVPEDNPFQEEGQDERIWSYGHRNGFGLTFIPGTGELIETENGPSCDDELNLIEMGKNYGWGPDYFCNEPYEERPEGENPQPPLYRWNPLIAPTDPTWYEHSSGYLTEGLYMGDFIHSQLHLFEDPTGATPEDDVIYNFNKPDHSIISVSRGPGGWLYLIGRHNIYRLVPGESEEVHFTGFNTFSPRRTTIEVGGFVRWFRAGNGSPHDIVQRQTIFRMAKKAGPIDFTKTFSSGSFPYLCTVHDGMTGVVRVPPSIEDDPPGLPFRVTWATDTTDTGKRFVVSYKVDSSRWRTWKRGTRTFSEIFGRDDDPIDLQSGRDYSFRVRSVSEGDKSRWSPVKTAEL